MFIFLFQFQNCLHRLYWWIEFLIWSHLDLLTITLIYGGSPWSLVNSSAEHVSCSDRLPSPGHGDGPGGPGGFSKSSSHSGSKEGFSAGVDLLGLGTTALKNVQNKLLSYNNHCVRYGDGPWNIQTSGFWMEYICFDNRQIYKQLQNQLICALM